MALAAPPTPAVVAAAAAPATQRQRGRRTPLAARSMNAPQTRPRNPK
ncbi:rCG54286, isoform CRA_b [Rattus norvegicus]|uniref:RCG54286, isoform CRA_b n=1 Tax=Rattus norvegicus TaxID=10116 RepID=A6J9Q3_RAT|nr:rCG54286, isoform CRA_b [Rattus norvegicus]